MDNEHKKYTMRDLLWARGGDELVKFVNNWLSRKSYHHSVIKEYGKEKYKKAKELVIYAEGYNKALTDLKEDLK